MNGSTNGESTALSNPNPAISTGDTAPASNIPSDIFEALVSGWTEILLADYAARHPEIKAGADVLTRDQVSSALPLGAVSAPWFKVEGMRVACSRCNNERWICEEHPSFLWPHEPCAGSGEKLFEFFVGHDRYLFELRDHGEALGVECQIFKNEELLTSRRFDPRLDASRPSRELAIQWAEAERKDLEKGGVS